MTAQTTEAPVATQPASREEALNWIASAWHFLKNAAEAAEPVVAAVDPQATAIISAWNVLDDAGKGLLTDFASLLGKHAATAAAAAPAPAGAPA